jgi:hypothetical protein
MWTGQPRSAVSGVRRVLPVFGLVAALIVSSLGSAAPGRAAATIPPEARLQVIVKSVTIYDDHDPFPFGVGELRLSAALHRCVPEPEPCVYEDGHRQIPQAHASKSFEADEGEAVALNWILPDATEQVFGGYDLSEGAGFPLYPGERYLLIFEMMELDENTDDYLGAVVEQISAADGWHLGTRSARGLYVEDGLALIDSYEVLFEIRRTPLPDLRPTKAVVRDGSGGLSNVCLGVVNEGSEIAGPFQLIVSLDQMAIGIAQLQGLAAEATQEVCINAYVPPAGEHQIGVIADQTQQLPELDEYDNEASWKLDRTPAGSTRPEGGSGPVVADSNTGPGAGNGPGGPPPPPPTVTPMPTPTATPIPALADLTVRTIRIRGREPDGKDDCKDGKNDVAVVVKNEGKAVAGAFVVALTVDNPQGILEEPVSGLEVGQEHEVRFDDVRLKKGTRTLTATADVKKTVAESDEANNARSVTAACKDDD